MNPFACKGIKICSRDTGKCFSFPGFHFHDFPLVNCDTTHKLCIKKPWPGMMRTMWGDHERFIDTYFTMYDDIYFAGDGCRIDNDGDFWLMGRIDDVVNVSGHRIGTAEVESALVAHAAVAEAAVVGYPHEIKGQGIFAYVILTAEAELNGDPDELVGALKEQVRHVIGPVATPDAIMIVPGLPKTRSGKIMRRLLRDVAENREVGDVTTLADSSVMDLIKTGLSGGDEG